MKLIKEQVAIRDRVSVLEQVSAQVRNQVWGQVLEQVGDLVLDQVWGQVRNQVLDQVKIDKKVKIL